MKRIFLVGAPRSGTTMLQSLLASHPAIISVPESRFFQYLLDDKYAHALGERLEKFFVDEIKRPEFLKDFSSEKSTLEKAQQFVKFLDTLASEENQCIWLEKTPEHLYFIDYIEELLPEALFIHILRNPLDVIASMYEASRKAPDIWGGAWEINWCISRWKDSALISHKNVNKTNHILVKYEEVVEDPKEVLSKLCKFIGIDFDESMLNNYKENAKRLSLKATWHEGIERDIKSSKIHKYHSIFKKEEIEYILKEIKPVSAGVIQEIVVEVTEPILDINLSAATDRIYCIVKMEGEEIGSFELPVCDGLVAGSVLADTIATKFAWQILGRFFQHTIWKEEDSAKELHNKIGWKVFLQDICGRGDWECDRFYDSQVWEETATQSIDNGFLAIEISEEIPHLEVTLLEIDVLLTVGGVAIGVVTVKSDRNFISAQALRVALINASGFELCRACVREGLLGKPLTEAISLRSRLAAAKAKRQQSAQIPPLTSYPVPPNYAVLGRNSGAMGTSVSRRAMLPVAAAIDLWEMSDRTGESARQVPPVVEHIIYAPDFIKLPSRHLRSLQQKIQHTTDNSESIFTEKLPILMYRRIIPSAFEEQLRYLRDNGYYSIGWENWQSAIASKTPLPGKAVLITFDGGYQDFYEYAWPLLKTYGFKATVFLVCDRVGQTNNWEKADSEEIQLMGWSEIRQLQQQEIDFGSLGITYQPLTTLSAVEIVREAARSRRILEQALGVSVKVFAYPYGDFDPVVQHLIGACGYTFGIGSWSSLSSFSDNLLGLPRIEITGNEGLQEFVSKLNLGWVAELEERVEAITIMQLAETGFQEWNDPEEDIYNDETE